MFCSANVLILTVFLTTKLEACPYDQPHARFLDGKIVGGKDTTIENHPYQLSLQRSGHHTCGASLIKPNVALTAAHCTDRRKPSDFTIRAGSSNCKSGGKLAKIVKICQHPKYSHSNIDYDVAVLHLDQPFEISPSIQTVSLQPKNKDILDGTNAVVTGWGTLSQGGSLATTLQEVAVPRVAHDKCSAAYPKAKITDRMICFGYTDGGKDSCQGDSGGPLVVDGNQVGVVSWGYGCAQPKYPGVYTKVANEEINDYINECISSF